MTEFWRSVLVFLPVLGVLVFVHELGHYAAARWVGVHVDTFSIGFGRSVLRWTDRVGTQWKIGWLPLGGYVSLHGTDDPADAGTGAGQATRPGRVFREKPLWARAAVVAAGPVANFLLTFVLFAGLYALAGREVLLPRIGAVLPGSAAAQAGLSPGDTVTRIGDEPIRDFARIQTLVQRAPGRTLAFAIDRRGRETTIPVTIGRKPAASPGGRGQLGIQAKGDVEYERLGPVRAVAEAARRTGQGIAEVAVGLWQVATGRHGVGELGGPVRIAQLSGQISTLGFGSVVAFVALLSVNLGVVNLLPIPILDGGHLVFDAAEAIRGRKVTRRVRERSFQVSLGLVALAFLFLTWNDLARLGLGRWTAHLAGRP